jgi:hypothetical protein
MSKFFKRLFGSEKKVEIRKLSHPRDLRTGDIIKFCHLSLSDVSEKEFEVSQVNTYIYESINYPEFILKDRSNNIIYMMVEEEDGEEYLALSKKIKKSQITEVIDQAQLNKILKPGIGSKITIASKAEGLEDWLADKYTKTDDAIKGSFVKGDTRYPPKEGIGKQEKFSSHTLVDKSEEYALEIEFYASGETELSVTAYLDLKEIEEMWPGNINE